MVKLKSVKNLKWVLGLFISLLCGYYFVTVLIKSNLSFHVLMNLNPFSEIFFSCLIWLSITYLGAIVWKILLFHLKEDISVRDSFVIVGKSQFGKYLPGNFGHLVGRVLLAKFIDLKADKVVCTMIYEFIIALYASALITLMGIVWIIDVQYFGINKTYFLAFLLFFLLMSPLFFYLFRSFLLKYNNKYNEKLQNYSPPPASKLIYLVFISCCGFLISGLVINYQAITLFNEPDIQLLSITTIFVFSWIIGFITPGAPAGLGVRDAVFVSGLSLLYSADTSAGLAVFFRITSILGDGLTFLVAIVLGYFYKQPREVASQTQLIKEK